MNYTRASFQIRNGNVSTISAKAAGITNGSTGERRNESESGTHTHTPTFIAAAKIRTIKINGLYDDLLTWVTPKLRPYVSFKNKREPLTTAPTGYE